MEADVQRFIVTVRATSDGEPLSADDIREALVAADNGNFLDVETIQTDVEKITMVDRHSTGRMKTNRMTYTVEDVA